FNPPKGQASVETMLKTSAFKTKQYVFQSPEGAKHRCNDRTSGGGLLTSEVSIPRRGTASLQPKQAATTCTTCSGFNPPKGQSIAATAVWLRLPEYALVSIPRRGKASLQRDYAAG